METLCNTCDTLPVPPPCLYREGCRVQDCPLYNTDVNILGQDILSNSTTIFCLCIISIIRLQVSDLQAGQAVACPGFDMQSSIVLAAAELTVECGDTRMCHYNFPVSGQSQGLAITLVFTL